MFNNYGDLFSSDDPGKTYDLNDEFSNLVGMNGWYSDP